MGDRMTRNVCALLVAFGALGCAKEPPVRDASMTRMPSGPGIWPPAAYGAPLPPPGPLFAGTGVAEAEPPGAPPAHVTGATSPWWPVATRSVSSDIPGGDACLSLLDQAGVKYARIEGKKGVDTPIEIKSPIGGIRYDGGAGNPMITDCRLAVALDRVAPILRELRVSSLRFSGAYSYRMSRVGRLSLHAYGLALDVHEIVIDGQRLSVQRDFVRGLANGCAPESPALNRVACELERTGMFRELLTPDYNADHANHFHLAIARLPSSDGPAKGAPPRAVPAPNPPTTPPAAQATPRAAQATPPAAQATPPAAQATPPAAQATPTAPNSDKTTPETPRPAASQRQAARRPHRHVHSTRRRKSFALPTNGAHSVRPETPPARPSRENH
jgi:hypothetical protein